MPYKILDLGVILLPSLRSLAYLHAFLELGIAPREMILMAGEISNLEAIKRENERYRYHQRFFDVHFNITDYIRSCGAQITRAETADINSPLIENLLKRSSVKTHLFTGGGIVKSPIFDTGKTLIHVHPGIVPEFRGSTCFYYSILQNNSLGSTAFFMEREIDKGDMIAQTNFQINYQIQPDQPLFMDYILDPYIRACTLKKVLRTLLEGRAFEKKAQLPGERPAYYVMHPFLRHAAIQKINRLYDPAKDIGIFEPLKK